MRLWKVERRGILLASVFTAAGLGLVALVAGACQSLIFGHDHEIHDVVKSGDNTALAKELSRHPDEADRPGAWGMTPLGYAVSCRNEEAVAMLLKQGASPTRYGRDGISPLSFAQAMVAQYQDLPGWLKKQEDSMRARGWSDADIQKQMEKIRAANPPEAKDQWLRILDMLGGKVPAKGNGAKQDKWGAGELRL